jgi:hypothetical protein
MFFKRVLCAFACYIEHKVYLLRMHFHCCKANHATYTELHSYILSNCMELSPF